MKIIKFDFSLLIFFLLSFLAGFIHDAIIIYIIIVIHELGHVLWTKIFKKKILSITLYPFGGVTKTESLINDYSYQNLIIYFGGIINQIILILLLPLFPLRYLDYYLFRKYNLSILIFNLIPIVPLDGYLILNHILNFFLCYRNAYYISLILSCIFLIVFTYINFLFEYHNYAIILFLVVISINYFCQYNYLYNRLLLERFVHKYHFKKDNRKTKNNLFNFWLGKNQFIYENGKWISEGEILAKMFDK
jgi:stage IV sporulation protein FB